jgi:succinyl-diaminopimelate desuccinylase
MKHLLRQLIRADSTAGKGEAAAAEVVARWFTKHGVDCRIDRWDGNRANVIAQARSARKRPGLLFLCHLDVVGPGEETWNYPPFGAVEKEGRMYGRGAVDMKGGIAAVAAAICKVVNSRSALQGDIVFAAAAGEETDSSGVQRFMRRHGRLPKLAGVVVPEPTDLSVVTAHRGLLWLKITTRGKAAHSSMPERGVNAITSMRPVLDALERYSIPFEAHPLLGKSTLGVNTIDGGEAMNIIPDRCTIGVDIRTLPGQDHEPLRYDIERILVQLKATTPQFDAELVVERSANAMETDPECEFVQRFCAAAGVDLTNVIGFTTDAPHVVPLGAPIVICGPGKSRLCHQANEYIDLADLERAADLFANVIRTFLV